MLQWNMPRSELPPWMEVSPQAKDMFTRIAEMPLGSVPGLSQISGHDAPYAYPIVTELQDAGVVDLVTLSCLTDQSTRLFASAYGRTFLIGEDICWHQDGGRAYLLDRFPVTEALPHAAASITKMGRLTRFHWFKGVAWDAAAHYEDGWALVFWSGLLEKETLLTRRFEQLGEDLLEHAAPGRRPWPGLLFFVVHDRWQAELVKRVARRRGLEDQVQFWYIWDQSASVSGTPRPSRGGVFPQGFLNLASNWSWEARVEASFWSRGMARRYCRLLCMVAEWPRMTSAFAKDTLGESPSSRNADRALQALRGMERPYLEAVRKGRGYEHTITNRLFNLLARIDRVPNNRIFAALRGPVGTGNSIVHDNGVLALTAHFLRGGLDVAAGWRSLERWHDGGIEPDLMVCLNTGPYGPGWVYVEYERTARYAARAGQKLLRYLDRRRQDDFGLLLVAWNDQAERHFQEIGARNNDRPGVAKLITTTLDRLARYGALGNDQCWSWYGLSVKLG